MAVTAPNRSGARFYFSPRQMFARSSLIALFCAAMACCVFSDQIIAYNKTTRTMWIYNIHNKETIKVTYKKDGKYIPAAMKKINHIMRDWRRNESRKMRTDLIDLMWEIHAQLGSQKPIHLISGYRSRKTNNKLRRRGGGQARFSRHILGMAADVHFPDIPVRELRDSALIRQKGGVGYYPTSGLPFVHMDVGRVRHWPRLPRKQLAVLFPSGRSRHVPRDGRPLTKKDAKKYGAVKYLAKMRKIQLARRNKISGQSEVAIASLDQSKQNQGKPKQNSAQQPKQTAPANQQVAALSPKARIPTPPPRTSQSPVTAPTQQANYRPKSQTIPAPQPRERWWNDTTIASLMPQQTKLEEEKLVQLASIDSSAPRDWQSFRPRQKPRVIEQDVVAYSPQYDDEHPEEFNYRPFSLSPLMTDQPLAFNEEIAKLSPPDYAATSVILKDDDKTMIPARFRPGLQYGQMMWANQFIGEAVTNIANPDRPLTGERGTAGR